MSAQEINEHRPGDCPVCFDINPVVTSVVWHNGIVMGIDTEPCAECGRTTEQNLAERERRGLPWPPA